MPEQPEKTQDELLAELKDKYGIDVTALQELQTEFAELKAKLDEKPEVTPEVVVDDSELKAKDEEIAELKTKVEESAKSEALVAALTKALGEVGVLDLSNTDEEDELTVELAVSGVAELAEKVVSLSSDVESLVETNKKLMIKEATAEVDALAKDGFILPAKKATMLKLRLSDEDTFRELLPSEPIVKMSNEIGLTPAVDETDNDAATARVTELKAKFPHLFSAQK